jgi:hypothetical protein
MAGWAQFETEDPSLAAEVRAAFAVGKHCTMATVRADGGPRISGTEVEFVDGEVYLGMGADTRKARDLQRDPRVAIHSPTRDPAPDGSWVGEAKVSGRAEFVAVPPEYPPNGARVRVELTSAVFTGLTEDRQQLRIRLWQPGRATQTMLRS